MPQTFEEIIDEVTESMAEEMCKLIDQEILEKLTKNSSRAGYVLRIPNPEAGKVRSFGELRKHKRKMNNTIFVNSQNISQFTKMVYKNGYDTLISQQLSNSITIAPMSEISKSCIVEMLSIYEDTMPELNYEMSIFYQTLKEKLKYS